MVAGKATLGEGGELPEEQSSHVRKCPHIERPKKKERNRLYTGDFQLSFVYGDVSGSQLQTMA